MYERRGRFDPRDEACRPYRVRDMAERSGFIESVGAERRLSREDACDELRDVVLVAHARPVNVVISHDGCRQAEARPEALAEKLAHELAGSVGKSVVHRLR